MGVLGAKGALSGEVECARRELRSPGLGFHVSGSRRRAEQVWGEAPCGALLLHRVREGTWGWQFAPGSGSAMTLRIVLLGLLQPPPPPLHSDTDSAPGPRSSWVLPWPPQFWRKLRPGLGLTVRLHFPLVPRPEHPESPGPCGNKSLLPVSGGTLTSEIWTGGEPRLAASEGREGKFGTWEGTGTLDCGGRGFAVRL